MAAYLRDLGAVVVRRRGGIVLDRGLLAEIDGSGHAAPTNEVERKLYLLPQVAGGGEHDTALRRRLTEIDRQLIDLLWEERTVMRALLDWPGTDPRGSRSDEDATEVDAPGPRNSPADPADDRHDPRVPRTIEREEKGFGSKDQHLTSLTPPTDRRGSADESRKSADVPDWADDNLFELLDELIRACEARGLPGLSNPAGALAALRPYTRAEVRRAQAQVARQVIAGQSLSNPIGVLVSAARAGHPGYFPPAPAAPPPPPVIDEPAGDPLDLGAASQDAEAMAAVRCLEADASRATELAALDELVLADLAQAALSPVMMRSPSTLRPLRSRAWRQSQGGE